MKAFKIFLAFAILLGIIYYQLDKRLFFYGKNDLQVYSLLPFHVIPDYRPVWEGGFALRDSDGVTLAADGNIYTLNGEPIKIKKVLRYGYRADSLTAVIKDDHQKMYCLSFNRNPKIKSDIVAIFDVNCEEDASGSYSWIILDGNEKYINRLELCRNWLMFIMILSIPLLGYLIVKLVKRKK